MGNTASSPHYPAAVRATPRRDMSSDAAAMAAAGAARLTPSLMRIPGAIWRGLAEAGAMCLTTPPPEASDGSEHRRH